MRDLIPFPRLVCSYIDSMKWYKTAAVKVPQRVRGNRKEQIANIALSRQVSNAYHRENESLYQKNLILLTICNDTVTLIYRT
ncbi:hypothetical protein, partial [Leptolyngbya sp. FACHB-17]|uniref:hypothetical protein n=1 Tax=Leptolyngbya sp. FACHB-17 TaxID=2692803 RepID=UPI001A7EC13A